MRTERGYVFEDKETGTKMLVRCPSCGQENYVPWVATGVCSWCGFNANEEEVCEK